MLIGSSRTVGVRVVGLVDGDKVGLCDGPVGRAVLGITIGSGVGLRVGDGVIS